MSIEAQAICLAIAFVAFLIGAFRGWPNVEPVAIGLAAWVFIPLFEALKAL